MKIFLIIFFSSICLALGAKFFFKYKRRKNFFDALIFLCHKFDVEINFSREKIVNIISSLEEKVKQNLYGLDKNFFYSIENKEILEKDKLLKNLNFLSEEEGNSIFLFFKSLGRSDMENQLKEIKSFENKFSQFCTASSKDYQKYGKLSIKLAIVSCLMIVVLFI